MLMDKYLCGHLGFSDPFALRKNFLFATSLVVLWDCLFLFLCVSVLQDQVDLLSSLYGHPPPIRMMIPTSHPPPN